MDTWKGIKRTVLGASIALAVFFFGRWIDSVWSRADDAHINERLDRLEERIDSAESGLRTATEEVRNAAAELNRATDTVKNIEDTANRSAELTGDIGKIIDRSADRFDHIESIIERIERDNQARAAQADGGGETT